MQSASQSVLRSPTPFHLQVMIELPATFSDDLRTKYDTALKDHHLVFNGDSAVHETIESKLEDADMTFHLTELKSLEKRPENGSISDNPFAKPEPELTLLTDYGVNGEFKLVLNKFPVVPYHFMLITNDFVSQNTPLSPKELLATYKILQVLEEGGGDENWFAFYNCGPMSGASQPHKHIQFMSLPEGYTPFTELLARSSDPFIPDQTKEPLQNSHLPFAHFLARLPLNPRETTEEILAMTFVALLQRTLSVLRAHDAEHISYNFCATTKYMMLVPRSKSKHDSLGVNSCGMMGLVLCKNEAVVTMVKLTGFENILKDVGYPNTSGKALDEYCY